MGVVAIGATVKDSACKCGRDLNFGDDSTCPDCGGGGVENIVMSCENCKEYSYPEWCSAKQRAVFKNNTCIIWESRA